MLKANISSKFVSQDIVSSFSMFDPKKVPAVDSSDLLAYGEDSVDVMLHCSSLWCRAETIDSEEYTKGALVYKWSGSQKKLCAHS